MAHVLKAVKAEAEGTLPSGEKRGAIEEGFEGGLRVFGDGWVELVCCGHVGSCDFWRLLVWWTDC